eukprot:g1155.t1
MSEKFVTVIPNRVAEVESNCFQITVTHGGSVFSWFSLNPRYRTRSSGDPVELNDLIVFESMERSPEHIHLSGPEGEINSSYDMTPWKVIRFSTFSDFSASENFVPFGSVIQLKHPQSRCFLSVTNVGDKVEEEEEEDEEEGGEKEEGSDSEEEKVSATVSTQKEELAVLFAALEKDESGETELQPDSNFLWVVEKQEVHVGGRAMYKDFFRFRHLNCNKYLCRGTPGPIVAGLLEDDDEDPNECMALTSDRSDPTTIFQLLPSKKSSASEYIANNAGIFVRLAKGVVKAEDGGAAAGTFLGKTGQSGSEVRQSSPSSSPKTTRKSVMINVEEEEEEEDEVAEVWINDGADAEEYGGEDASVVNFSGWEEDNAMILSVVGEGGNLKEVCEALSLAVALGNLCKEMVEWGSGEEEKNDEVTDGMPKEGTASAIMAQLNRSKEGFAGRAKEIDPLVLNQAVELSLRFKVFCKDPSQVNQDVYADMVAWTFDAKVKAFRECERQFLLPRRQQLLKEQRVLEYGVKLVGVFARVLKVLYEGTTLHTMVKNTCSCLYNMMVVVFDDHRPNQMFATRYMDSMINHIPLDIDAATCLTELVEGNEELLNEKITEKHIQLFIDLIRDTGFKAHYVRFLTVLCKCQGEACDDNQDNVNQMLLLANRELLLSTRLDGTRKDKLEVKREEVDKYITKSGGECAGLDKLLGSPPALCVSWKTKHKGSTPQALYQKTWVPLAEFCKVGKRDGDEEKQKGKSKLAQGKSKWKLAAAKAVDLAKLRRDVYEFYVGQVELMAAMCLSRNYLGIYNLQEEYSYELCVAGSCDPGVPLALRAAFANLLDSLWIDCMPQQRLQIPGYSRAWAPPTNGDDQGKVEGKGEDVIEVNRDSGPATLPLSAQPNKFAVLQGVIENWFSNLGEKAANDEDANLVTTALGSCLRHLVMFGSYATVSQVHAVGGPIIQCLDSRGRDAGWQTRARKKAGMRGVVVEAMTKKQKMEALEQQEEEVDSYRKLLVDTDEVYIPNSKERTEAIMDEKIYMIFIIFATIVSVIAGIIALLLSEENDILTLMDNIFLALFSVDVALRWWAVGTSRYLLDWLCLVDVFVTAIDWLAVFFASLESAGSLLKTFRLLRLLRLLRLFRAAKLARELLKSQASAIKVLVPKVASSERYKESADTASDMECKLTLVRLLRTLTELDLEYRISHFMAKFGDEVNSDKFGDKPFEKFTDLVLKKETELPEEIFQWLFAEEEDGDGKDEEEEEGPGGPDDLDLKGMVDDGVFEGIVIDLLMYESDDLVSEALLLLFSQFQEVTRVLDAGKRLHLMVTDFERQEFHKLEELVGKTLGSVEAYEVWGISEDIPKVIAQLKELQGWIQELTERCSNADMQLGLLNLGVPDLVDEVFNIDLPSDDEDEDENEGKEDDSGDGMEDEKNELLIETLGDFNAFLIAFSQGFQDAQEELFEMDGFISEMGERVGVIPHTNELLCAIIDDNAELCKKVPSSLLSLMVGKIVEADGDPPAECLTLLDNVVRSGDKTQSVRVLNLMTKSVWISVTIRLFADPKGNDYKKTRQLMTRNRNCMQEPLMQYNSALLKLLSHCCLGNFKVTEAKCKTLFPMDHLLHHINDENTIWNAKSSVLYFLFHVYLEATTPYAGFTGLSGTLSFIKKLAHVIEILSDRDGKDIRVCLQNADEDNLENPLPLADKEALRVIDSETSLKDLIWLTHHQILPCIAGCFDRYEFTSDELDDATKVSIATSLKKLRKATTPDSSSAKTLLAFHNRVGVACQHTGRVEGFDARKENEEEKKEETKEEDLLDTPYLRQQRKREKKMALKRKETEAKEVEESLAVATALAEASVEEVEKNPIRRAFKEMLKWQISEAQDEMEEEYDELVKKIREFDDANSDVNIGSILKRMVDRARSCIELDPGGYTKTLEGENNEIVKGTLKTLLALLRAEGDEASKDRDKMVNQATIVGAIRLVVDLIAPGGVEDETMTLALQVGVAMLTDYFAGGGNTDAQMMANEMFQAGNTESFFFGFQQILEHAPGGSKWNAEESSETLGTSAADSAGDDAPTVFGSVEGDKTTKMGDDNVEGKSSNAEKKSDEKEEKSEETDDEKKLDKDDEKKVDDADDDDGDEFNTIPTLLLEFVRLLSEGHFKPNQLIMLKQPGNQVSVNLFEVASAYLVKSCRSLDKGNDEDILSVINGVIELMIESLQGPCFKNQVYLALSCPLLDCINRIVYYILRLLVSNRYDEGSGGLLEGLMTLVLALLEGRSDTKIHAAILESVNFDNLCEVLKAIRVHAFRLKADGNEDAADDVLGNGYKVACILLTVGDFAEPKWFEKKVGSHPHFQFFKDGIESVEISWLKQLHIVYFRESSLLEFIVEETQDRAVEEIERTNSETKLRGLSEFYSILYSEMKHQKWLDTLGLADVFSDDYLRILKAIAFKVTLLINLVLLLSFSYQPVGKIDDNFDYEGKDPVLSLERLLGIDESGTNVIIMFLGLIHVILSIMILVQYIVVMVPPNYQALDSNPVLVLIQTPLLYFVVYAIGSIVALNGSYWVFCFHLLDICKRNMIVQQVVMAVVYPFIPLVKTFRFMTFVIFIITMILFLDFPSDMEEVDGACVTLWQCTLTNSNFGLRNGFGELLKLYDPDQPKFYGRQLLYDLFLFYLITIVILAIVSGLVIDTFSELRGEREEKYEDKSNICTICSIDRNEIERAGITFNAHIKNQHNMWSYMKYFLHLWEYDPDDFNGMEDYVFAQIENGDIDFFPVNAATCLQPKKVIVVDDEDEDEATEEKNDDASTHEKDILAEVGKTQNRLHEIVSGSNLLGTSVKNHANEVFEMSKNMILLRDQIGETADLIQAEQKS